MGLERSTLHAMQSRPSTTGRRLGAVVGPAIVGALLLASCGGAESGATQSTINLDATSTAFVVRPPATTVPPAGSATEIDAEGRVQGTQEYTVQPNDYPFLLVDEFGITLEDLLAVNSWDSADEFPGPGAVILIPPGALPIGGTADAEADAAPADSAPAAETETETETEDAAAGGATDTIPDAGDNCAPGSYTIASGDYPIVVAEKFDVTVEALNDANAGTSGYSSFFVGLEIVIPAKSDC
jgi:LysM repeat protein